MRSAATKRGNRRLPALRALSSQRGEYQGLVENMWRTPVTPWARYIRPNELSVRWACMSHSPGIRYLPLPSTTCAPAGMASTPVGPRALIRAPQMRTVVSGWGGLPVASITVTPVMTSARRGGAAPRRGEEGVLQHQASSARTMRADFMDGLSLGRRAGNQPPGAGTNAV